MHSKNGHSSNSNDPVHRSRRASTHSVGDPTAFTGINDRAARAQNALDWIRSPRHISKANKAKALEQNLKNFQNDLSNHSAEHSNLRALAKKYNGTRRNGRHVLSNNNISKKLAAQATAQANMRRRLANLIANTRRK